PMPRGDTWVEGGRDIGDIIDWVKTVRPGGGTVPLPSFQKAFSLDPPPDVIFFMTDGIFVDTSARIAELNGRLPKKAAIHTILFENSPSARMGGALGRAARLVEAFDLPADVREMFAKPPPVVGKAPRVTPHKQLEEIAAANGGMFRVFGGEEGKIEVPAKG